MFLSLYQLIRMIHNILLSLSIISKQCEISVIPFIRQQKQKSTLIKWYGCGRFEVRNQITGLDNWLAIINFPWTNRWTLLMTKHPFGRTNNNNYLSPWKILQISIEMKQHSSVECGTTLHQRHHHITPLLIISINSGHRFIQQPLGGELDI